MAQQFGDQQARTHFAQQAGEVEVAVRYRERMAAAGVAGGLHAELAGRIAGKKIAFDRAGLHYVAFQTGDAFRVEGRAAQSAALERRFADVDVRREYGGPEAVEQEGRLAVQAAARDGGDEIADESGGDGRFEDDRTRTCVELAAIETAHGALPGDAADGFGRVEMAAVARAAVPVVALHRTLVLADHRDRQAVA